MSYILKNKWKRGEATFGAWCMLPGADYAETLAQCGFDWICLDMQHSYIDTADMQTMIKAISGAGAPTLVRLIYNRPEYVMKALDSGACGVIAPMVETAEEGAEVVKYAKYPPVGLRSWGAVRYDERVVGGSAGDSEKRVGISGGGSEKSAGGRVGCGADKTDGGGVYTPEVGNGFTVVALMIETAKGMANVDEIAAVPGVDALFVGPFDLALSHGMKPPTESDEYESLVYKVADACKRHGIAAGIYCSDVAMARKWAGAGLPMLACSSDAALFREAASNLINRLRCR